VFDSAICVQAARRGRRFESALRGVHAPHGDRSRASRRRKLVAPQRNAVTQAPRAMNPAVHGRVQRCGDCKRFGERVPSQRRDAGASGQRRGKPAHRPLVLPCFSCETFAAIVAAHAASGSFHFPATA
jgi:hypothetical protein